jgi:hypothetical protein
LLFVTQAEHQEIMSDEYPQWSLAREELVKVVKHAGMQRPSANRLKRKQGLQESPQECHVFQDAEQE